LINCFGRKQPCPLRRFLTPIIDGTFDAYRRADESSMNAGRKKRDTRFESCANHQNDFTLTSHGNNQVRQTNSYNAPTPLTRPPERRRP
jgi:hypothetical protein